MHDSNTDLSALGDFTTTPRVAAISLLAIGIGIVSAFVALALLTLIGLFTNLFFFHRWSSAFVSPYGNTLGAFVILVPVAGALVIGVMARYGSERIRGHGIPEAIEAILISGSRVEPRVALLKPISAAISIGSGGPFGAEGPIIMTSAERKTLLVAGAAAGMSATFASPVAAVLLAVELLLFEWKPRSMVPGALSAALTQAVYASEDAFQRLPIHWMWWPALGGLVIGLGGCVFPQALGVGYDTIGSLLQGNASERLILGILIVKSVIWSVSFGSGTSGGVPAPLLMMGVAAHEHPHLRTIRDRRHVAPDGFVERVEAERPAQRLAEGHQPLQLADTGAGDYSLRRGGRRLGVHLTPVGVLMKDEHHRQDQQRRHERHPVCPLDLRRDVQEVLKRPLEDDEQRDDEPGEQQRVVPAGDAEVHAMGEAPGVPSCRCGWRTSVCAVRASRSRAHVRTPEKDWV